MASADRLTVSWFFLQESQLTFKVRKASRRAACGLPGRHPLPFLHERAAFF